MFQLLQTSHYQCVRNITLRFNATVCEKFTPLPNILTIWFQHFNYDEQLQEPLTPVINIKPRFSR